MGLFSNSQSVPVNHGRMWLTRSKPAAAPIGASMSIYLAAIMILLFALLSISVAVVQLKPSPATPANDFGDIGNPQKFAGVRADAIIDTKTGALSKGGDRYGRIS